jgi:hypothetical protein
VIFAKHGGQCGLSEGALRAIVALFTSAPFAAHGVFSHCVLYVDDPVAGLIGGMNGTGSVAIA